MLEPYIIEWLRRERQRREEQRSRTERPFVELPLPADDPQRRPPDEGGEEPTRVIVIEL